MGVTLTKQGPTKIKQEQRSSTGIIIRSCPLSAETHQFFSLFQGGSSPSVYGGSKSRGFFFLHMYFITGHSSAGADIRQEADNILFKLPV